MKLNNEYRYGISPRVNIPRSRFLMHKNVRTTFNAGELIPIYVNSDIYPGDTFSVKGTFVCRESTPIHAPMDNAFIDIRAFFCPHRINSINFKKMMGENETGAWTQTIDYEVPKMGVYVKNDGQISDMEHKVAKGDLLNYMGFPIGYPSAVNTPPTYQNLPERCKFNAFAMLSYCRVWSEWYRDENFVPPLYIANDGAGLYLIDHATGRQWGKYEASGHRLPAKPAPVYKFKDYYNSCLPEPQKSAPTTLPIGSMAPVIGNGMAMGFDTGITGYEHLGLRQGDGNQSSAMQGVPGAYGANIGAITSPGLSPATGYAVGLTDDASKSGIIADLSNAVAATINAQRMAFAIQRISEAQSRTGSRFCETIKGLFHVDSPMSAVLQRPEYLGGYRVPLQMTQVPQTSSTDATTPQGNISAFSITVDSQKLFTKSFTEWGTLLILACVRTENSYSSGIPRMFNRKKKLEFYWPQLAFLGEQAIKMSEIYADGSANDEAVWGYNERWIELRTEQNLNTGAFAPEYAQSLDTWHYGTHITSTPVLSDAFRRETKDNIDRTLAVQSATEDQFLFDSRWYFDAVRALPLRSIPGLLDHF